MDEGLATHEDTTRMRILDLVVTLGPVSSAELAQQLGLTAAGIRRHIGSLEADGLVTSHEPALLGTPRRGRPARHYIATDSGRDRLGGAYSDLATAVLEFLEDHGGPPAVEEFALTRVEDITRRYEIPVRAAGEDPRSRAEALAVALSRDGFAATVRGVGPAGHAIQLCQGHCPVLKVAQRFPHLCDAELQAFARLLGTHVQRLATLAEGEHVCTTHIPLTVRSRFPEGTP